MIKLVIRRHYAEHGFEFSSIKEAVEEAVSQLEHDQSFPSYIEKDGIRIWEQSGPIGVVESLKKLAGVS